MPSVFSLLPSVKPPPPYCNSKGGECLSHVGREGLAEEDPYTEVFFADEVDVDLNPRIGSAWMRRGEQTAVPTPGQNEKHYIAGALHAHTGRLVWVEHPRKNSVLFVKLLEHAS